MLDARHRSAFQPWVDKDYIEAELSRQAVYTYEVVSSNGCGVHSKHRYLADAWAAAERHAERSPTLGPFEIQQVRTSPSGGRRYWLRSGSQWVPWHHQSDIEDRQPDWRWG